MRPAHKVFALEESDWHEYERRKRQFLADNPEATSAEFEKACRRIAAELDL